MEKDFDSWNCYKKEIEQKSSQILYKEGEIWWASIGVNIGYESCGKGEQFRRPVLILKKLSRENCIVIPLSTQIKKGTWFFVYTLKEVQYTALLYQVKMMHTKRFTKREAQVDDDTFGKIKKRFRKLLNL